MYGYTTMGIEEALECTTDDLVRQYNQAVEKIWELQCKYDSLKEDYDIVQDDLERMAIKYYSAFDY